MIDILGHHDHRDLDGELATLTAQIRTVTDTITTGDIDSDLYRDTLNIKLTNLQTRAHTLHGELAAHHRRLDRLAAAVHAVGDPQLGFIAYVVFGPTALPMEPLYEVRLLDPHGYTVPGAVRTDVPAGQVETTRQTLRTVDGPAYARQFAYRWSADYRVQVTAY